MPIFRRRKDKTSQSDTKYQSTTIRDTGTGSATSSSYVSSSGSTTQPGDDIQTYEDIKRQCLQSGTLWEDTEFGAKSSSVYFSNKRSATFISWKRPREICSDPQLFVDGATRMDVVQGGLGDCWLLAALASLSANQELFNKVVPSDQSFQEGYAGIFRFHFWQYGRWVEVLVDDRLPTTSNKLIYMHSDQRNEFWSALLEKAYAKVHGSYEALEGGFTSDALTDFTGGFAQNYHLGAKAPRDLFQLMSKAYRKGTLMGCSTNAAKGHMEESLPNGLIIGHAYSITDVREINVNTPNMSGLIPMVRIRNPWGSHHEWKGAWSDGSREWTSVSVDERKSMGLTFDNDGEFWMSFKDFVSNYELLEVCYLGPDSVSIGEIKDGKVKWEGSLFEGSWKRRVNAGGCRNYPSTFWTNPQYRVTVVDADTDDNDDKGTILVGLMQKGRRKMKKEGKNNVSIGYGIYKAPNDNTGTLNSRYFQNNSASAKSSAFSNLREVAELHRLAPGDYVVVPSTFEPDVEADYVLRIYSERKNDLVKELDDVTGISDEKLGELVSVMSGENEKSQQAGEKAFTALAAGDGEINAFELQQILNDIFTRELAFEVFSGDVTRSMVAMKDIDFNGKLSFYNFQILWLDLSMCKNCFMLMDTDKSGYFSSYELRDALGTLGFRVSNATFNSIVMRYSDHEGHINFADFVALFIKLKTIFETLKSKDPSQTGKVKFDLEEFITLTMYS